jgi:hypothetical protein
MEYLFVFKICYIMTAIIVNKKERDMKRIFNVFFVIGLMQFFLLCAVSSGFRPPAEPSEGGVLLVGNILFEVNNWNNISEVDRKDIQVGIIGLYEENGKTKEWSVWVPTDTSGYFWYANAPDGKYEVKALKLYIQGDRYAGFEKTFRSLRDNFRSNATPDAIMLSGVEPGLITISSSNRIVSLNFNYFTIHPNGEIIPKSALKIANLQLVTGEEVNTPLIYDYFIDNPLFKDSGWLPLLKAESSKWIH